MLDKAEHIGMLLRKDVFAKEDEEEQNIGSVLVSAHCEMTNEQPEERLKCEECVLATVVEILMANTTEEIDAGLKNLKVCSLEYLSEEHDECIDKADSSVVNLLDEMKELQECGTRIMVRNVVTSCMSVLGNDDSPDEASDQLEKFLQVDNCGKAVAARWMDRRG